MSLDHIPLWMSNKSSSLFFADALPALWIGPSDMGVFTSLCSALLRLPLASHYTSYGYEHQEQGAELWYSPGGRWEVGGWGGGGGG